MKTILLAGAVMLGVVPLALAYSPGGPIGNTGDAYQVGEIGYGLPGDLNAPKNLAEEYRRITPEMYYACDTTFQYFGDAGYAAVDGAFAILNGLTNVSSYSPNLSEFPLNSRSVNYQAQALGMLDMKSAVLGLMMEQLGLADPVRYSWGLHDRLHVGSIPCPVGMEYTVMQRNFDFVNSPLDKAQASAYINDVLFSYQIVETCVPPNPIAEAVPYSVDPLADAYTPVATYVSGSISLGDYYTGLTRDDVAGLRYLLSAANYNWEGAASDSLQFIITTNANLQLFPNGTGTNSTGTNAVGFYYFVGDTNGAFGYGDLAAFYAYAWTNGPVALQAAYPGVVINSWSNDIVYATNETYSFYFKAPPVGSAYGTPSTLAIATNYTTYGLNVYYYQFANIFTNHIYTNTAYYYTTRVGAPIGSVYGSAVVTNYTVTPTNQIGGDFFVLPVFYTNFCNLDIVSTFLTNTLVTTNLLSGGTNSFLTVTTNTIAGTSNTVSSSSYLVSFFTNYIFKTYPVTCTQTTNAPGLYEGIEKIRFVRHDYDSLLGTFWSPVTNYYTRVFVTNGQERLHYFRRIVTQPDFQFGASDQADTPGNNTIGTSYGSRSLTFDQTAIPKVGGLAVAGPGTIVTPTLITFNKVGPIFYNSSEDIMDGTPYFTQLPGSDVNNLFYSFYFMWASFDGTTNAPVLMASGANVTNLVNQVLVKLTPATVPDGYVGIRYQDGVQFAASGGGFSKPFTWSATSLPEGMDVSADGILEGTPAQSGTFKFTLTLVDHFGQSVQWYYSLTIQE